MNFAGRGLAVVYSSLAGVGRKAANPVRRRICPNRWLFWWEDGLWCACSTIPKRF